MEDLDKIGVLSLSGDFAASIEERKLLCLLSDGRLLIAEGQGLNPHVLSYRARLEMMNRPYRPVFTNIGTVMRMYDNNRKGGEIQGRHQEHTLMQVTAKDLLKQACAERASDIHIRVRKTSTDIYFRIHNDLVRVGSQTREHGERLLATLYGAMTSVSDNSYKPTERQDAAIADRDKLPAQLYGVRIATAPSSEGPIMVLRLLYNDAGDNIDLRPLGFTDTHADMLQRLKEQPIGINIISGPTGSGKSTTLYGALNDINEPERNIITIEDPVEYQLAGVNQLQVNIKAGLTFASGLRAMLRADPDVIMVGEIRDSETAKIAIESALTGHLVLSTLHTNDAPSAISRLTEMGIEPFLTASAVTAGVAQRLVRQLCPHCKRRTTLSVSSLDRAGFSVAFDLEAYEPVGCGRCGNSGYKGRTGLYEVMPITDEIRDLTVERTAAEEIRKIAVAQGMRPLRSDGFEKVKNGITSIAEVARVT
jgi:type II secretory ATPase GspE/PulE/Tfp pilus assembly ATPase PilB-like protein